MRSFALWSEERDEAIQDDELEASFGDDQEVVGWVGTLFCLREGAAALFCSCCYDSTVTVIVR